VAARRRAADDLRVLDASGEVTGVDADVIPQERRDAVRLSGSGGGSGSRAGIATGESDPDTRGLRPLVRDDGTSGERPRMRDESTSGERPLVRDDRTSGGRPLTGDEEAA
jgi:hypothetical protein